MNMNKRGDRKDEDFPPYSQLFIVCGTNLVVSDFQNAFSRFGTIEYVRLPRDLNTGHLKGVCYIKYSKTSEAALALQAMNNICLKNGTRPLKVMISGKPSDDSDDTNEGKKRLFICTNENENEIYSVFEKYGPIESVLIQKDWYTGRPRGFAYVKFNKFSHAALAYEQCDKKYRAIFATPKERSNPETSQPNMNQLPAKSGDLPSIMSFMNTNPRGYNKVNFICSPYLTKMHVERLFDIVPGMENCHYVVDLLRDHGKGVITFSNPISAAYAVEKLDQFEYPPGQKVFVTPCDLDTQGDKFKNIPSLTNKIKAITSSSSKPDLAQLAEVVAEATKVIKLATEGVPETDDLNYCSVKLPPPQPVADIDSPVAKRCFLVCKPQPPPLTVLRDIFCRFGDLINIYTLPNKTVGYARYASVAAADEAIKNLHGAEVCGVRIKVLEAEEESNSRKRRYDEPNY